MIENSFGILAQKFRIFRTTIIADVSLVESITQACVCLHNWLREKNTNYISYGLVDQEVNGQIIPGSWRQQNNGMQSLQPLNQNSTTVSKITRDRFSKYFSTEGSVEWQLNKI